MNVNKSCAVALGTWNKSRKILDIPYKDSINILGMTVKNTIREFAETSWNNTTAKIRKQAQESYHRNLSLDKRIPFIHEYLYSRAWYVAQICPPTNNSIRQINTTNVWFLWKGAIYKVPLSTLHRQKTRGGWGLVNFEAKSYALLLYRMRQQISQTKTIPALWMRIWKLNGENVNPPNRDSISARFDYLQRYHKETAYVTTQSPTESTRSYKRRLYTTMLLLHCRSIGTTETRIQRSWSHTPTVKFYGKMCTTHLSMPR
jgi:hypothetical protein